MKQFDELMQVLKASEEQIYNSKMKGDGILSSMVMQKHLIVKCSNSLFAYQLAYEKKLNDFIDKHSDV